MSTDPFSLVYDRLWELLESHKGFTDLVKLRNRTKFSGNDRSPLKDEVLAADLPEVRLIVSKLFPHIQRTSSSGSVNMTFEVQISTGDQRLTEVIFPVVFEIIRAMHGWPMVLQSLEWRGIPFVVKFVLGEIPIGTSDRDKNRGIIGWSTVWTCDLEIWLPTTLLQPDLPIKLP